MPTIAFFIRNTSFYSNYIKPYADLLKEKGYKIVIIHSDKITKELSKDNILEPYIIQIDLFENSLKKNIEKINKLNISAIVAINFHSPLDLLVNRLAKFLKIKTVYMEHGILAENPGRYIVPPNKLKSLKRVITYITKYLSFCILSRHFFRELKIFLSVLLRKKYKLSPYDNYLLYAPASFNKLEKIYNLSESQIQYSGYPIESNDNFNEDVNSENIPYVVYIHQPYVFHKIGYCNYENEFNFLKSLGTAVQKMGYKFIIKLHPLEVMSKYKEGLENNFEIVQQKSLNNLIKNSFAVIGHFSTALFVALKYKKPLIQIAPECLPKNSNFMFFSDVSVQINDVQELKTALTNKIVLYNKINNYDIFFENIIGQNNTYNDRVSKLLNLINS